MDKIPGKEKTLLIIKKVALLILLGLWAIFPAVQAQAQGDIDNRQLLQAIKKFHSSRGDDWNWQKKHTDRILVSKVGTKAYVVSAFKKQYESMGETAGYIVKLMNRTWQVVAYYGAVIIEEEFKKTDPELFDKKNEVNIVLRD